MEYDSLPRGASFGKVVADVSGSFVAGGGGVAEATFWGANPRADLKHGGTFIKVRPRLTN